MPRGRPRKITISKLPKFTLQLESMGKVYEAVGETIFEALSLLRPPSKAKGMLTILKDGKKFERFLSMREMLRLFTFPESRTTKLSQEAISKLWQTIYNL